MRTDWGFKRNIGRVVISLVLILLGIIPCFSQNHSKPKLEIFAGAELHYRDIFYNKMYEVLVNLTPGVKWNMGNQWMLVGQAIIPVYNDYGDRYKKIRLNMAVLSKEWDWNRKQFVKVSGGLFGMERYGLDVKWMMPVNNWLALDAQLGVTGFCSMAADWECSKMKRVTGWAGARVYIDKVNMEFRLKGGRFVYEDYGVYAEAMRHFKHCTVGVYAQYSDEWKENGGFKVVMMIPPYKRKTRKVQVRPASNFRLTYDIQGQGYAVKTYTTDPEENEREGFFNRERLDWGANKMQPDFAIKEKKGGAEK